jgi:arylsulfatase A-like enzyme
LPGLGLLMPGDVAPGGGYHGGVNPHELNTVLIACAPSRFPSGVINQRAAGIIDIGPTILDLLDVPAADTMVGKSLARAAQNEARLQSIDAGNGSFAQQIVRVDEDGRSFILHGGQA